LRTRPAEDATKITIDPNIKKLNEVSDVKSLGERKFKKPEEGETCEMCSS
jgi:hypothetical protein